MSWYCIEENPNDEFSRAKRRILFHRKSFTFDDVVEGQKVIYIFSNSDFVFIKSKIFLRIFEANEFDLHTIPSESFREKVDFYVVRIHLI